MLGASILDPQDPDMNSLHTSYRSRSTWLCGWLVATLAGCGGGLDPILGSPGAGSVRTTVGRVVSASGLVMKVHTKSALSPKPATSLAAVVTVAVHSVATGNGAAGVTVAVCEAAS